MPEIVGKFSFLFYGEKHIAFMADDHHWYVRLDHLCERLGLDPAGQRRRVEKSKVTGEYYVTMETETEYMGTIRMRKVGFLNLDLLPYWLGTIEVEKLKEDVQTRVILYQKDFIRTARDAYRSEMFDPDFLAEMDTHLPPEQRTMNELMAEFMATRRKVEMLNGQLNADLKAVGLTIQDLGGRIERLEAKIKSDATVYPPQANAIREMIAAVGTAMFKANPSMGKSKAYMHAQQIFKDEFGVHIYSALPLDKYEEAVRFLQNQWRHFLPGEPLPDVFHRKQSALFS
jgi:hypothetical protein